MKKKTLAFFALVLVALTALFALVGCNDEGSDKVKAKAVYTTETAVVLKVTETDGKATLEDAMKSAKEEGGFTYTGENSTYGLMITAINGLAAEGTYYWACYTTDKDNADTATKMTVDGVDYYYALAGASTLKVKTGASYLFVYLSWA